MPVDSSDPVNWAIERVLEKLWGFASVDISWGMTHADFVKGFPNINPDQELPRPIIAVYDYNSETLSSGYDNIVWTNGILPGNPGYEEQRGVVMEIGLYVEVYTSKPKLLIPTPTGGGTICRRLAGRIETRLQLNSECLGDEIDLLWTRDLGPFEPPHSNAPRIMGHRLDVGIEICVVVS